MEIKILDSILRRELKPWKIDTTNKRRFTLLVRTANAVSPKTIIELQNQLKALVTDYPSLQKALDAETPNTNTALQPLFFKLDLPKYNDLITQFYYSVIKAETLRVFNIFLQQTASLTEQIDIRYEAVVMLKRIGALTQQTAKELRERGFATIPDEQSNLIHFALYYLKHSLIILYFSIQETFKDSLVQVITLEDFYLQELEEPFTTIPELVHTDSETESNPKKIVNPKKLTFDFTGKREKLKPVINQLCMQIELLNEQVSPADTFLELLLSKDIKPSAVRIQLGCDNKNFRHVIEQLMPYFNSLSFINIEHSKSFYSKRGTLLRANNFSKAISFDPKEKATIDNIFKQMQ